MLLTKRVDPQSLFIQEWVFKFIIIDNKRHINWHNGVMLESSFKNQTPTSNPTNVNFEVYKWEKVWQLVQQGSVLVYMKMLRVWVAPLPPPINATMTLINRFLTRTIHNENSIAKSNYPTTWSIAYLNSVILGGMKSLTKSCLLERRYMQVPLMIVSRPMPSSCTTM